MHKHQPMILCLRERPLLPRCIEVRFFTGTLRDWFRNKLAGGLEKVNCTCRYRASSTVYYAFILYRNRGTREILYESRLAV